MKFLHRSLVVSLFLSITFMFGCKDDDGGGGGEIVGQELSGTWVQQEADDVTGPVAAEFTDFSISISASASGVSYTTNSEEHGNPNVFPPQGSFTDIDASDNFESGASVTRQPDGVPMDISLSSDGQILNMTFTINTDENAGGRYQGIDGQYQFTLTKQQTN